GGNVQETKVIVFADQTLIRGRDNTQTVPVKVDEQGRLVLAADLNIDVGDISIGTVEQGKRSESAEPWEVIVSGSTTQIAYARAVRNASPAPVNIIIPSGARAAQVHLRIYGVTGAFAAGQGLSL